ncbi:MAG: hypothetical protein ACRC46_05725 [Thermoguttaceae bacterium]
MPRKTSRQSSPARVAFNAMRQRAAVFALKYSDAIREEGAFLVA